MIKEMSMWRNIFRENNVSSLNEAVASGKARYIVNLSETLHDHRYAEIANMIASRKGVRIVLIAGPSSSGKTTSSKRLALHMRVNGQNPIVISLDDYFRNRVDTPLDENGEYDFECLEALDVPFLNQQLEQLLAGEKVEIPKYDFASGTRKFVGQFLQLTDNDVLIMEGIHGLNPALTPQVPDEEKFKLYVSVLTPISVDAETKMSSRDYRLMRRMVRDNQFRGMSAEDTILRWPSVGAGEEKHILPYKKFADATFNSALFYEIPMLKCYAEPLLQVIHSSSLAFGEAQRLLNLIRSVISMTPLDVRHIPPTSIMREFIGGSSFHY
ncbi:MAG: nucleoside kinase [Bacteroidales bacterium]|nr:nucleoside kinase [Bacteroidales bacterium]